jgi:hypothetical protein
LHIRPGVLIAGTFAATLLASTSQARVCVMCAAAEVAN